jgi:3-dehydrosphinganine reductase
MVMEYFRDKCVLITGGSSGIGLAAARILRPSGAHLVLVARDQGKLDVAQQDLTKMERKGDVQVASVDISDEQAVKALAADVPGGRPVDVLICNAGVVMPGHFLELPQEQFDQMLGINYLGAVYLCRAFLPSMIERGGGDVHLVSSLAGLMGVFGYTAYSASKFALRGFAEVLRCEMKPRGVRVTASYPPDTDTPQLAFEDQYKPDETRAISGNAKKLSAEAVAGSILQGIAVNKFHIVPGGSAKLADVMGRWFPGMVRGMFDSDVKKVQKKRDPAQA